MWAKWIGLGPVANALTLVVIGALSRSRRLGVAETQHGRQPGYPEIAMLMVLVPLISPQGWDYVLLLATPATIVIVDRWYDLTPAWRYTAIAAQVVMGLTIFDLMGRALYARFMMLSIVSVAAIGAAVALTPPEVESARVIRAGSRLGLGLRPARASNPCQHHSGQALRRRQSSLRCP